MTEEPPRKETDNTLGNGSAEESKDTNTTRRKRRVVDLPKEIKLKYQSFALSALAGRIEVPGGVCRSLDNGDLQSRGVADATGSKGWSQSLDRTESGHIQVHERLQARKLAQASSKAIVFPTLDPNRSVYHQFDDVLNNAY